mgnify:CR=1 FL=1
MKNVEKYQHQIIKICKSFPVKRLGLFGSVLGQDFTSESDIDVFVVFDEKANIDLFNTYFELKEKLEEIFHRPVDLVIDKDFRNPYFRESVEKTRKIIYER